ncbi:hypothetical protein AD953_06125 [Acetobacter malorum]|uniref:DUF2946 domain-containing protein n=1 Tax=Acetobacter malorum TaxID=178901 RepID=A0A149V6L2_9PROT|nr:DUF2946 family protein [Acetobacter malorum]KXV75824.1 hypothetical protein AD953_06125 [Acetobacter malorum]
MVRTQARIWIGLLACLLMQVGLLAGISPAQAQREAQAHHVMMHHMAASCSEADAMDGQCMMTHPDAHTMPHGDKCCHVHVAATDIPAPAEALYPVLRPMVKAQSFSMSAQTAFAGADWLPPLRPPRILNS